MAEVHEVVSPKVGNGSRNVREMGFGGIGGQIGSAIVFGIEYFSIGEDRIHRPVERPGGNIRIGLAQPGRRAVDIRIGRDKKIDIRAIEHLAKGKMASVEALPDLKGISIERPHQRGLLRGFLDRMTKIQQALYIGVLPKLREIKHLLAGRRIAERTPVGSRKINPVRHRHRTEGAD